MVKLSAAALFLSVFLFSSCGFGDFLEPSYDDPAKEFFKEYTETAAVERCEMPDCAFMSPLSQNCVGSEDGCSVLFFMRNPQMYNLDVSVSFPHLPPDVPSDSVKIEQTGHSSIRLDFPKNFLIAADEGKNISPTVSLFEPKSGRSFPDYSVELYCNSPPPLVENATVLNGNGKTFVLAFDMPDASEISVRHKDLRAIVINGSSYRVDIATDGGFSFSDSRFTTEWNEEYSLINSKSFTPGKRSVFFDTQEPFSASEQAFSIALEDEAGLRTEAFASTEVTRLNPPAISVDKRLGSATATVKAPATDNLGNPVSGVEVDYRLYNAIGDSSSISENGTFTGEKTFELTVGTWRLEAFARKTGYETSSLSSAEISVFGNSFFIKENGSDDDKKADGTAEHPYKTIKKAVSVIEKLENPIDYSILVDGKVAGTQIVSETLSKDHATSVSIRGASENSGSDILDGNGSGTTLLIKTQVPVTIGNLKITGGKDSHGGGLKIEGGSQVELSDGAVVADNQADYGGGIYNGGKLCLSGSAIVGTYMDSAATSSSFGNKSKESGGGIFSSAGSQIHLGYSLDGNEAELTGGVCGNFLENTENANSTGGGIYSEGYIKFDSGNVSFNYAMNGAGIYTLENVEMSGGTIEGNEGNPLNTAGNGGGVCVSRGGWLSMSGDAVIRGNKNIANGAGVYLDYSNTTLEMTGGTIIDNTAFLNGGAVYMHDLNEGSRSSLKIGGKAYIPSGEQNRENDIFLLDKNTNITIVSNLESHVEKSILVSVSDRFSAGVAVLSDGSGTGTLLQSEYSKFQVADNRWEICNDGRLRKRFECVTVEEIKEKESSMTKGQVAADFKNLLGKLLYFKTSLGSYGVLRFTSVEDNTNIQFEWMIGGSKESEKGFHVNWGKDLDDGISNNDNKDFGIDGDGPHSLNAHNGAKFFVVD